MFITIVAQDGQDVCLNVSHIMCVNCKGLQGSEIVCNFGGTVEVINTSEKFLQLSVRLQNLICKPQDQTL